MIDLVQSVPLTEIVPCGPGAESGRAPHHSGYASTHAPAPKATAPSPIKHVILGAENVPLIWNVLPLAMWMPPLTTCSIAVALVATPRITVALGMVTLPKIVSTLFTEIGAPIGMPLDSCCACATAD